jgi:hypothetical protein
MSWSWPKLKFSWSSGSLLQYALLAGLIVTTVIVYLQFILRFGFDVGVPSVSVSRSACLTCVAAGSDDLPWPRSSSMDIDTDKIDEAVLALLYLTLHDGVRAWKGHESVVLTDEGLAESERLFRNLFERSAP